MLRRLLRWLVALEEPPDLSWRIEPHWGPPNVVGLKRERLRRMPVMLVGFVTERDVLSAERRRAP